MTTRTGRNARFLALAALLTACATPDNPPRATRPSGTIALGERIVVPSRALGTNRTALVHLPDGYPGARGGYPVIVVLDGESSFLTAASAARFLARAGLMPDAIIVGIENADRVRDFTPQPTHPEAIPAGLGATGGASAFTSFIGNELIPALDERYDTAPARVLIGHSLGGLLAMHVLATKPDLFRGYVTLEPSLWWDRRAVADSVRQMLAATPALRGRLVMVERGTNDGWIPDSAALRQASPLGFQLMSVALDDVSHEMLPYQGFHDGLRTLFHGYQPEAAHDPDKATLPALESQYASLSEVFGYDIPIPESAFLAAAARRIDARVAHDAVTILERARYIHPRSARIAVALDNARSAVTSGASSAGVPV